MDDLKKLFNNSGLTFHELSKLSGVSLSTTHRYVNNKTKEMDDEHYSSIYEILKEYKSHEIVHDDYELDYIVLQAERAMYKTFHDQFMEMYKKYKSE